jgi:hypothetical protein
MTDGVGVRPSPADSYSPELRTALVLSGTGTAGSYHAGVLRALHEAGVKLDIVAGRGIGAVGALFAAIDGAQRLWDDNGFWRNPAVESLYGWRIVPRIAGWSLGIAFTIVTVPIAAIALGLIVFPIDFVLKMIGGAGAPRLVNAYLAAAQAAFAADGLPTWLPRLALLVLGAAGAIAVVEGWTHRHRASRGAIWWSALCGPLDAHHAIDHCWNVMWDLVRGAAQLKPPARVDLGRRYTEMLAENLGQPGFRELLIAVHDVDAHRDLLFALVGEERRRTLIRRPTTRAADARRAEVYDLAGVARDYLPDAVAGALTVPIATNWHSITFAPDAYWRGETHRIGDRPANLIRIVDELVALGVEQIVLVSAAPESSGPHALARARIDFRGRLGEYIESAESAVLRDALTTIGVRFFTIRPLHHGIGPFDFSGGYDDRSHRSQPLAELMSRGYEDAYHQFIEPVVGASGERVGQV